MTGFNPDQISLPHANNFIGGRRVAGRGPALVVRRPSDGRVQAELDSVDADQLTEAVESAQRAYRTSGWAQSDPRARMKVMRRWADLIEADASTLAPLEALGSTRMLKEINAWDLSYTAETIRFFAEWADKVGGEVAATTPDKLGLTITEPYGVVAAIAPWNLPLVMAGWKIAPAIAAGNSIVLKPSEMTPFSIVRLAELAIEAGLPAGIFNVVQGDGRSVGDPARHLLLVRHVAERIEETDSDRLDPFVQQAGAQRTDFRLVRRLQRFAAARHPLLHAETPVPLDQWRWQSKRQVVAVVGGFPAHLRQVAETAGGHQSSCCALALDDRIGDKGGRMDHLVDAIERNVRPPRRLDDAQHYSTGGFVRRGEHLCHHQAAG